MTNHEAPPPLPTTFTQNYVSHVQCWMPRQGKSRAPRWSVCVVQGSTDEELDALVKRAVWTFRQVGEQLATARAEQGNSRGLEDGDNQSARELV